MKRMRWVALVATILNVGTAIAGPQQFFSLGDFRQENGQVIQDCRLGYRTFGALNASRSNAVLVPTWFTGTSAQKSFVANAGGLADSTRFFTIIVDAFGNGVSSSPSNSAGQPGKAFPAVSIRDMVRAQYELVSRHLGLPHLYAVMGISMGGMQSFQWAVSYPTMMDNVVPIIGTPKQSSYDKILWNTELRTIERAGEGAEATAMKTVGAIHFDHLYTPHWHQAHLKAEDYDKSMAAIEAQYATLPAQDWACQLRAMLGHDVFAGRPVADVLAGVKARTLVVVATQDHMVNPQAAIDWAKAANARLLELTSDCGHMATSCESATLVAGVRKFLGL